MAARGIVGQRLAGRGVFVASAFPVGRRIVRSGHGVGELERQDDGGNIILHICKYENRLL